MSFPSSKMRPTLLKFGSRSVSRFRLRHSVDLPLASGPMIARRSFGRMSSVTLRRTWFSSYDALNRSTSIFGGGSGAGCPDVTPPRCWGTEVWNVEIVMLTLHRPGHEPPHDPVRGDVDREDRDDQQRRRRVGVLHRDPLARQ